MINKILKTFLFLFLIFIIVSNVILYNHAYNFTHFSDNNLPKVTAQSLQSSSLKEQAKLAFLGVEIPKSKNKYKPQYKYQSLSIGQAPKLKCWLMPTERDVQGVVLLFHGYTSKKSNLLNAGYVFRDLGYHCLLVDFRAHGDSEGLETTIGYKEAEDVKRCYESMRHRYPKLPLILMGTSMGSVSILKAIHDYDLKPKKIIIECPFEDMRTAVVKRFQRFKLPTIIIPDVLLFWGDWQTGIKSRAHSSLEYAKKVSVPTLMIYGAKDQRVSREEIDAVYETLAGPKELVVFKNGGHDHIIDDVDKKWTAAVWKFLKR